MKTVLRTLIVSVAFGLLSQSAMADRVTLSDNQYILQPRAQVAEFRQLKLNSLLQIAVAQFPRAQNVECHIYKVSIWDYFHAICTGEL